MIDTQTIPVIVSIIVLLPLLGFVIQIFFGKRFLKETAIVPLVLMGIALVLSIALFWMAWSHSDPNFKVETNWKWIDLVDITFSMGILFDNMTAIMLVVVTLVSFLVYLYSSAYMHGDPRFSRYYAFLCLFSFSMLLLITVNNFWGMFMGWELVGICSYLLIGHWFEKDSAANAGKKAFIVNRVGDFGFAIGIFMFFTKIESLNFGEVFHGVAAGDITGTYLTIAGVCIFGGAIGKSAQVPLHIWLPDAMEGPTPVSALIHAATMVAAGVYMVARVFPIFSVDALTVIAFFGAVTAFLAATIAIVRFDIKKVLAYSTVSQLGYMVMGLGAAGYAVSGYSAGMFHLMTHACFKALLFLGSGSVIHAMHHEQDMRQMGGLKEKLPWTYWTFLIGTLALAGVPFLSGFFSKDAILAAILEAGMRNSLLMIPTVLGFLAAGMTAFYMFRAVFMTFFGEPRNQEKYDHAHESPPAMLIPLVVLAVLSVIVGYFPFDEFVQPPASNVNQQAIVSVASTEPMMMFDSDDELAHTAHNVAMGLSIVIAALGIGLAIITYYPGREKISADEWAEKLKGLYNTLRHKYYFDEFNDKVFVRGTLGSARGSYLFDKNFIDGIVNGVAAAWRFLSIRIVKPFDDGFVDGIVNFIGQFTVFLSYLFRNIQTGRVQTYLMFALFGMLLFLMFRAF